MVHPHTVHLPLSALLSPCTVCGTGAPAAELHVWTRLRSHTPPYAPLNAPLFPLPLPAAPPLPETPAAHWPAARTVAEVLATPRDARPWAAPVLAVRCVLRQAELMEAEQVWNRQ